jgi:DNA-binding IclR family transcriptional regulator
MYLPAQKAMMFAAKADSPQPLRYRIDLFRPLPLGWGASGLAILAFLDDPAVREFVAREPAPVTGERRDPDALAFLLAQTRRNGFVVTCGEKLAGAVGIAAPLHSPAGKLVGSITLTVPAVRFETARADEYGRLVRLAATGFARLSPTLPTETAA